MRRSSWCAAVVLALGISACASWHVDPFLGLVVTMPAMFLIGVALEAGGLRIADVYVFGFALCLAILGAPALLLYRTTFGAAIRATMLNRTAAQLIGIDAERVSALAFGIGIGMATAAAGGVVFGITNAFNPGSHYDLISRPLTIIVLGGLGSLRGAIVAALLMLVVEDVTAVLVTPTWADFTFFVVLVVVLLTRPPGLYGLRARAGT
jgi:branched-chain amino acid transport system permease protein